MTSHTQQALQANVQRLLDQAVADGEEIGCQVAVFVAGAVVVLLLAPAPQEDWAAR